MLLQFSCWACLQMAAHAITRDTLKNRERLQSTKGAQKIGNSTFEAAALSFLRRFIEELCHNQFMGECAHRQPIKLNQKLQSHNYTAERALSKRFSSYPSKRYVMSVWSVLRSKRRALREMQMLQKLFIFSESIARDKPVGMNSF